MKYILIFLFICSSSFGLTYSPRNQVNIESLIKSGDVAIDWYDFSVTITARWHVNKGEYQFVEYGKTLVQRKARWLFDDILVELIKKLFRNPVIVMDRFYEMDTKFNVALKKITSENFKVTHRDLRWKSDGNIDFEFTARVPFYGDKGILRHFYPMIVSYVRKYTSLPGLSTSIRDNTYYYHSKQEIYPYHKVADMPDGLTCLIIRLNKKDFQKTLLPVIADTDRRIIFGYENINLKLCGYRPCPEYKKTMEEALQIPWAGPNPYVADAVKTENNYIYIGSKDARSLNLYFKNNPEIKEKCYICIVEE